VLPLEKIIEKLTSGKAIFEIENQSIREGNSANLTLFSTEDKWVFGKEAIVSKSKNSAFLGQKMKGKAIGIYNNGKLILA
jgi:dihydroorotase